MRVRSKQSGFTLVEMLVSMALFTVVAFIVTTLFISVTAAYRRAQAAKFLINDISFTLEGMVSRLKDGREFQYGIPPALSAASCPSGLETDPTDPTQGCTAIAFKTRHDTEFVYRLNRAAGGQIERCDEGFAACTDSGPFKPITSSPPAVKVTGLAFKLIEPAADRAKRIQVLVTAESEDNKGNTSKFQVRTTVTPFNI